MDSNTHSTGQPPGRAARPPDNLEVLAAAVEGLAAQDLDRLADPVLAERVLVLRQLLERLEGHWLKELATVDGRGAAGAEAGPAGRLDRGVAAGPAAARGRRGQQ
jgi:hypothetical protein